MVRIFIDSIEVMTCKNMQISWDDENTFFTFADVDVLHKIDESIFNAKIINSNSGTTINIDANAEAHVDGMKIYFLHLSEIFFLSDSCLTVFIGKNFKIKIK